MIRGLDEELAANKYAHVERERRFLVDPARCPDLRDAPAIRIEDRYIDGTRFRLRRMTDLASGRVVLKLSKKYDIVDALFATLPGRPLLKHRHAVATPSGTFGIDVFAGPLDGLLLAEIECRDEASLATVVEPDWSSREVTDDPRFQGGALSRLSGDKLGALQT